MKQDLKNNPKIKLGNVDIPDGWDNPRNLKWRITCWLDGDIYDELRRRAQKGEGKGKYQTLMNEVLRTALLESDLVEPAVSVSQLKTLVKNLERGYNPFLVKGAATRAGASTGAKKSSANIKRKATERTTPRTTAKRKVKKR